MIGAADAVVLLADAEHLIGPAHVRGCDGAMLGHVISDAPLPAACEAVVERYGIEVTTA